MAMLFAKPAPSFVDAFLAVIFVAAVLAASPGVASAKAGTAHRAASATAQTIERNFFISGRTPLII